MCGLAGFLGNTSRNIESIRAIARTMGNTIAHRGPDDQGVWGDTQAGLALAHQRLAIVDLSQAGAQPMISPSQRYVLVFNGEIYNHQDLRLELEQLGCAPMWRGHSDTETLLAAFEAWGLEETLRRSQGMFAIAAWDRHAATLTLARDRLGEKPLYYGYQGGELLFGSELKALKAHPAFEQTIDRHALSHFLRVSSIPSSLCIYAGIQKLLPGTYIQFSEACIKNRLLPKPVAYWSLATVILNGINNPFLGSEQDAIGALETTLRSAICSQQLADVPLGAFLSGGIDSSTIVALMQSQSSRPIKTFTIGFDEKEYNEAEHAKAVAKYLGTEHTELYISAVQARDVIPILPRLYDEPFSDPSQIPTFLVAKLARQHVTVALSGDAGDELFGGYNRYVLARSLWGKLSRLPLAARRPIAALLSLPTPASWDQLYNFLKPILPGSATMTQPGDKLQKFVRIFSATGPDDIYQKLISHWEDPASVVIGGTDAFRSPGISLSAVSFPNFEDKMMAQDLLGYLPDDILVKVDRAAMGVSLETRIPMLDPQVIELAWKMPLDFKIRNGQGKWLLRQVLYRYLPKELMERPKAGFAVPIGAWLRGPLRGWAEALLEESRLRQEGFFNPAQIRTKWFEHLSGKRNWQYHLWDILMFQSWLEEQRP